MQNSDVINIVIFLHATSCRVTKSLFFLILMELSGFVVLFNFNLNLSISFVS